MDPQSPNEQRCRDIVAAYRRERMPTDARAGAWARLQAAIADEAAPVRARDRRRDLVWAAVLVAAALLVWFVGARGRVTGHADGSDAGSQAAHEAGPRMEVQAEASGAGPASAAEARARESDAPATTDGASAPASRPRAPAVRGTHVSKDMPGLDAELALLRAAREALGRGSTAAALESLEAHAREFPGGHLREERMLLRAQALCELGRRAEARDSAAELLRSFPGSPHARTAAALCAE